MSRLIPLGTPVVRNLREITDEDAPGLGWEISEETHKKIAAIEREIALGPWRARHLVFGCLAVLLLLSACSPPVYECHQGPTGRILCFPER